MSEPQDMDLTGPPQSRPRKGSITPKHTIFLDNKPSCLEFSPEHADLFVLGTYHLEEQSPEPDAKTITVSEDSEEDNESRRSVGSWTRSEFGSEESEFDDPASEGKIVPKPKKSKKQRKKGTLKLCRLHPDDRIEILHSVDTVSAVYHLHFNPDHPSYVLTSHNTGQMSTYRVNAEASTLHFIRKYRVAKESTDVTSFCWDHTQTPRFGTSGPWRNIAIINRNFVRLHRHVFPEWRPAHIEYNISSHADFVWTVTQGVNTYAYFTGGDDNCLRSGWEVGSTGVWQRAKVDVKFNAGVTAILPLEIPISHRWLAPRTEILLVGAYSQTDSDENLKVVFSTLPMLMNEPPSPPSAPLDPFDRYINGPTETIIKEPGKDEVVAAFAVGSGAWKLRHIPSETKPVISQDEGGMMTRKRAGSPPDITWTWLVLMCCMGGGAQIIEVKCRLSTKAQKLPGVEAWSINRLATFEGHESIVYAGEMLRDEDTGDVRCVSASFYDKRVCSWRYHPRD